MTKTEPAVRFANSKVLITGASGFIGSHLCRRLLSAGAKVQGLYRTKAADDAGDVNWWCADLSDASATRDLIAEVKPDVVFHLAGFVSGNRSLEAVLPALQSNLIGTVNLLTALAERGCQRVVLAGSMEEPEASLGSAVPSSPYAAAKFAGSAYGNMFHAVYDLPVVNARIFMVYGPGQRDLRKLVPYVTLSLLRQETPKLSGGTRKADWIYVDDVVDGLLATADAPDAVGGTFDLGSGSLTSVREIAERVAKIIDPSAELEFAKARDRRLESERLANVAESQARLGWSPCVCMDEGLAKTVAWYSEWLRTTGVRTAAIVSVAAWGAATQAWRALSELPFFSSGAETLAILLGRVA